VNGVPNGPALSPAPGGPPKSIANGTVTVHFVDPNCEGLERRKTVLAPVGASIVDVAKEHGVDIHAACGQKLQCATCHVILQRPFYELLQEPGVRETDLLESTFTLTSTSRLGCQVKLTPHLDGIQCMLPDKAFKGNVRMSLEQPRTRVRSPLAPGAVPAVVSMPSRDAGGVAGPSQLGDSEEAAKTKEQLDIQRNLAARLESELRQLRAAAAAGSGGNTGGPAANASAAGSGTETSEDGDESLAKVKAELQRTRVDVGKLGRRASFADVIGLESAKGAIREAVIWPAVADPTLFTGIRGNPRGLLLYGPPGCGKTMLARAAASELAGRASFFHVRPGDVMSKFYGESQRRVQALEELVREEAPAVVFLDEVDSLLGSRDGENVAEHHRATTNALLAWMDGFGTGDERVFFLGATNRAEAIDEAALRRFGEAAEVGAPSEEARLQLLRHLVVEKASAEGHRADMGSAELEVVAQRTEGFSLADVDRLVRRAFLEVLRRLPSPGVHPGLRPEDVPAVTADHFDAALKESSGTSALRSMLQQRAKTRARL